MNIYVETYADARTLHEGVATLIRKELDAIPEYVRCKRKIETDGVDLEEGELNHLVAQMASLETEVMDKHEYLTIAEALRLAEDLMLEDFCKTMCNHPKAPQKLKEAFDAGVLDKARQNPRYKNRLIEIVLSTPFYMAA